MVGWGRLRNHIKLYRYFILYFFCHFEVSSMRCSDMSCRIETLLRASFLNLGIYLPRPCLIGMSFLETLGGYPFVS